MSGSVDKQSTQEALFKQQLFEQMKKAGVLDGLKSQLRSSLYEQLKVKKDRTDFDVATINNRHSFRIAVSLVADLMNKCDMPYARSVFLPECGLS